MRVLQDRLKELDELSLKSGAHDSPERGMCAMEAAAWLAGEPHTDVPQCVDPVIRRLAISLNDRWDDERRQALKPLVVRSIGTGGDGKQDERRLIMMRHAVHTVLPLWLDRAGDLGRARALRALPMGSVADAYSDLVAAGDAVRDARDAMWALRFDRREKLQTAILAEMKRRGYPRAAVAAAAADAAVAVAVAVAAAAADAGVGVAAAAGDHENDYAVAVAVADAVADASVAAAVAVAAVADADAVAAVAAAAAAVAADADLWEVRRAVYKALREHFDVRFAEWRGEADARALDLLDRLIEAA